MGKFFEYLKRLTCSVIFLCMSEKICSENCPKIFPDFKKPHDSGVNTPGIKEWEMTDFIWNLAIASQCDMGLLKDPDKYVSRYRNSSHKTIDFDKLKSGDVIWMNYRYLPKFERDNLPSIKEPIVLVISDGDAAFPSECSINIDNFLSNPHIIHIFAQNCSYTGSSPKISHLPIGLNFLMRAHVGGYNYKGDFLGEVASPKQQEAELKDLLSTLQPTHLRKPRAFVDFHLSDTIREGNMKRYLSLGEDRTSIFNLLLSANVMDYTSVLMKRSDLWARKGEYAFSISPHGNGLDCYRTWEDLILGCIVIVKTSSLDPMYEGLPVVIVKDWLEVTEENLRIWLEQYGDAFSNPLYREKLTNDYWLNKIRATAKSYKEAI